MTDPIQTLRRIVDEYGLNHTSKWARDLAQAALPADDPTRGLRPLVTGSASPPPVDPVVDAAVASVPVLRCYYLTPEEDDALRVLAFTTGRKRNDIIVEAVAALLAERADPDKETRRRLDRLADDLIGWAGDSADARQWGGPTIEPHHPITEQHAALDGAALKRLLAGPTP